MEKLGNGLVYYRSHSRPDRFYDCSNRANDSVSDRDMVRLYVQHGIRSLGFYSDCNQSNSMILSFEPSSRPSEVEFRS